MPSPQVATRQLLLHASVLVSLPSSHASAVHTQVSPSSQTWSGSALPVSYAAPGQPEQEHTSFASQVPSLSPPSAALTSIIVPQAGATSVSPSPHVVSVQSLAQVS